MARSKSGFDWGFWAKACLVGGVGALAWVMWPGGQCLGQALGNEGFTALSADDQHWAALLQESGALSTGESMAQRSSLQRLLRALGPCTQVALRRSELWQWALVGPFLLLAASFGGLAFRQHRLALAQTMNKLAQTSANANPQPSDAASATAADAGAAPGRPSTPTPAGEPASRATTQQPAAVKSRFTTSQAAVGSAPVGRSGSQTSQHRTTAPGDLGPAAMSNQPGAASRVEGSRIPIASDPLASMGGPALRQAVNTSSQRAVAFAFDDDWDDAPLPEEADALPSQQVSSATDETIVLPSDTMLAMAPTLAAAPNTSADNLAQTARAAAPTLAAGDRVEGELPPTDRALAPTMAPSDRVANELTRTDRAGQALAATLVVNEAPAARELSQSTNASVRPATVARDSVAPATDVPGSPVRVRAFRVPPMTRLGRDIQLAIALDRPAPEAVARMRILGVLHGMDRAQTTLLDESLATMDAAAELRRDGRAIVRVPFRMVERSLQNAFERITGHLRIEFTLFLNDEEHYAGTQLVDSLTLRLASATGGLWGPGIVRLRSPDGQLLRVGVGASNDGLVRLESIMPGSWQLELEDDLHLHAAQGSPTRKVTLRSDAVEGMTAGTSASNAEPRDLKVAAPVVVWVRAGATGDGSIERPGGSIEDAFVIADKLRARLGIPYTPVEIRIFPNGQLPSERPGLVGGSQGQWLRWWSGQPADRRAPWTVATSELPPLQKPAGDSFARPLHFESVDDLRLVNAEYALLREKAALLPALCENLDEAYAQVPMVTFHAPETGGEGNRVRFDHCHGVRLEGLQVMGMRGINALSLTQCEDVVVSRCWFERAAAGPTGQGGWAPGRGVHVDASGTPESPIEFSDCDIGWNSVVRRSVPVRGAAMAAYNSHVVMARCYLHDNVATQEPPDVFASGNGSLRGEGASHRAGNVVAEG